jgi:hypothetical protein
MEVRTYPEHGSSSVGAAADTQLTKHRFAAKE